MLRMCGRAGKPWSAIILLAISIAFFSIVFPLNHFFTVSAECKRLSVEIKEDGASVLIQGIAFDDVQMDLKSISLPEGWSFANDFLIAGTTGKLEIPISAQNAVSILFVKNDRGGDIEIGLEGQGQWQYNSFSADEEWVQDVWVKPIEGYFSVGSHPLLGAATLLVSFLIATGGYILFKPEKERCVFYVVCCGLSAFLISAGITFLRGETEVCGVLLMLLLMIFFWDPACMYGRLQVYTGPIQGEKAGFAAQLDWCCA